MPLGQEGCPVLGSSLDLLFLDRVSMVTCSSSITCRCVSLTFEYVVINPYTGASCSVLWSFMYVFTCLSGPPQLLNLGFASIMM